MPALMVSKGVVAQWGGYYSFASDWEINANLGMTNFYGDITDKRNRIYNNTPFHKYYYQDRGFAYGLLLRKNVNPYFSVRGSFLRGKIHSFSDDHKMYFDSQFNSYYLGGELDVTALLDGPNRSSEFRFYAFLGMGFTDSRTWLYDSRTDELKNTNGFGEKRWFDNKNSMAKESTIPFGLGVSYTFYDDWTVNFETSIYGVNTDRLDAYVSDDAWTEGFGYMTLGLSYHFHLPYFLSFNRYPQFNNRSNDPAIRKYNKKKKVIMKTKAQKKASRKRYKRPDEKN
ncbi:MAG: outer membrane beta-barrel protein, partial [Bacteroidales bacterium]